MVKYPRRKPTRGHWWNWVCEFCHRQSNRMELPPGWDLVLQSAVCPDCQRKVARDGGYAVVKGGAYADGRPDPRDAVLT